MAKGADSIVRIPCKDIKGFFYYWIMFLKPFHHLTDRESEVVVSMLRERYELSKVIKDSEILDKVLMSEDTKRKVREECNITLPHFQIVMSKLRKNKVIIDNKINPRYIPRVGEEMNSFKMMLLFDFQ
jgi:hypothetical protein